MKRVSVLVFFVLIAVFSISLSVDTDWQLYKTKDGVNIYSRVENAVEKGITKKYLIFKYENTNKTKVEVSWKLNVWYNGVCRACDLPSPNEYELSISLNGNETKAGGVTSESKIFRVFYSSESEGIAPLDKFEFSNLKVKINK